MRLPTDRSIVRSSIHARENHLYTFDYEVSIVVSVIEIELNRLRRVVTETVELPTDLMFPLSHLRRLFRLGFLVEVFHFRATFFISCDGFERGNFRRILGISALTNRVHLVAFLLMVFLTMMSASRTGPEYAISSARDSLMPPAKSRPRIMAHVGHDI